MDDRLVQQTIQQLRTLSAYLGTARRLNREVQTAPTARAALVAARRLEAFAAASVRQEG